jgi:TRAP-type C4-dicarboxylate transport system permease small subunit
VERLLLNVERFSKGLAMVAKVVLIFSILLTVADVIGRSFSRPILGAYELVAFSGCIIFGFSLPLTSWVRAHVMVDLLMPKLSRSARRGFRLVHKCVAIGLFLIIGWNVIHYGMILRRAGEVSGLLHLPFYVAAYAAGACFLVVCLVLLCDIVKIIGETYE